MLCIILFLGLLGADDRPEDDRFESENRTNLKKNDSAPKSEGDDADGSASPAMKAKAAPKSKAIAANRVKEIAALKGKETAVEGTVVEVFVPKGNALAIFNLGKDRNNRFTVVIRERNFAKFGGLDKLKGFKSKSIRVEGTVSIYKDLPQIEVSVPSQLTAK